MFELDETIRKIKKKPLCRSWKTNLIWMRLVSSDGDGEGVAEGQGKTDKFIY
jgi:hypothetical protein